jgi:hypothetical protein
LGETDFSGKIASNIKVVTQGGNISVNPENSANIGVGSGDVDISPYDYSVPVDGLCYWLDASRYSTFAFDETKTVGGTMFVTNWQSRVAGTTVSRFYWEKSKVIPGYGGWIFDPPEYSQDGLNGKPAIKSKTENTAKKEDGTYAPGSALLADAQTNTRTIFMVGKITSRPYYSSGIFGLYKMDIGFRFNNPAPDDKVSVGLNTCSYMRLGDLFRINGVDACDANGLSRAFTMNEPFIIAAMSKNEYSRNVGFNSLPGYYMNRSPEMYVSEVIAYDRELSETEIVEIERYLKEKWIDNVEDIPPRNETVLANGSIITIAAENFKINFLAACKHFCIEFQQHQIGAEITDIKFGNVGFFININQNFIQFSRRLSGILV